MQFDMLRHSTWRLRILLMWAIDSLACVILFLLLPGISFERLELAIATVLIVGLLNALIRPTVIVLRLTPNLIVFGVITLAINALLLWLGSEFLSGFTITGFWSPLIAVIGVSAINITFSDLLAIDDDDSYYTHLVSHIVQLAAKPHESEKPGVIFLEIDGLSEPVLQRAIRDGKVPTMKRWLDTGSHRLLRWECDLSSQTSASQAGILLGSNYDIPAFRWYEKDRKKRMVSNHPLDTAEMERRLSTGDGLLVNNGASRSNLFSGDAPQAIFTVSTITDVTRSSQQDFYPLFMGPYNFFRLVLLFSLDLIQELRMARHQRRHNILPRVHRGGTYPLLRASTTVLMRELSIHVLIGDMLAGVPCVYATFVGYDEVAHHSGIERPDAIDVLSKLDEQFERLESTTKLTPRPYHFVVLSDHGQSQGATFKQRYGLTLEDFVREQVSSEYSVESIEAEDAAWTNVSVFLTDLLQKIAPDSNRFAARLLRRFAKNRMVFDQVVLGPYRDFLQRHGISSDPPPANVVVMASGNLGLIYFTDWDERLSYEKINDAFPSLIDALSQHEGTGFILVNSEARGPMAIGATGIHYLAEGHIEGDDPLVTFGPNAANHLKRTDGFPHAPDILINSFYDPEAEEVAAFEELVGSHGGLGGDQTAPFVMYPAEWTSESDEIIGAAQLHTQLKMWLRECAT
ncbi:MAG: phage holin family protein [Anaerolineales bacterium]|nr:phage holin family protein [Anaerolineales bacterium]